MGPKTTTTKGEDLISSAADKAVVALERCNVASREFAAALEDLVETLEAAGMAEGAQLEQMRGIIEQQRRVAVGFGAWARKLGEVLRTR